MRLRVVCLVSIVALTLLSTIASVSTLAATGAYSNTTPITFSDPGVATPADVYPSTIAVADLSGIVLDVNVTLSGLSHSSPADLRVLLVGPAGQNVILMSENGTLSTQVSNINLTFDDAASQSLPDYQQGTFGSGTYKPTGVEENQGSCGGFWPLPAPAPQGAHGQTLSVFNSTNPNGDWSLYVFDDCGADIGSIAGGWSLQITTTNDPSEPIILPDSGPANLYPSTNVVSDVRGNITDVNVTLHNLTDLYAVDLQVLLVGPGNQTVLLMSENWSSHKLTDVTLTFDDDATDYLPVANPDEITSGTYKPVAAQALSNNCNGLPPAPWPAPAPAGPYGNTLSDFNGTNPNGIWKLFVFDDCAEDSGSIAGGWSMDIDTDDAPTLVVPADITVSNDAGQAGAVVTFAAATASDHADGALTPSCTMASGAFFPLGTTTVTCSVTDSDDNLVSETFDVTVNDTELPTIYPPGDITVPNDPGQTGAVVTYPLPTVADNNPTLGAPTCGPISGTFFPIGTTTVTCTIIDPAGNSASTSFTVTVADGELPTIATPSDITVNATGPKGAVVTYQLPAASDNAPGVSVGCVPPPGSTFRTGSTTVTCTATDGGGNQSTSTFTVTVLGAADLLADLRADTIDFVSNPTAERALVATIDQARAAQARGNGLGVYAAILQYVVQLDSYKLRGTISATAAHQLAALARQALDAAI